FQRVVLRRIVGGSHRHAAIGPGGRHVHLNGGCRQDAQFHHFAPGRQQSTDHDVFEHKTAGARIAAHHHAAHAYISAEHLRELAGEHKHKELTHHAADTRYADLEQMLADHQAKLLTSSSSDS